MERDYEKRTTEENSGGTMYDIIKLKKGSNLGNIFELYVGQIEAPAVFGP